ncbi:unnamed protein product [Porites evermanni]|uniref:C2 domain-containing protein n=1 Tax=Porites evermanni TaxID=104178 RepID=A0ABN8Q7A4_9CNID|nr:unnamed protein product [Porites evermanni]
MTYTAVAYVIPVVVLFFFISSLASALLLLKKIRWRFWKRKKGPSSAELRQRRIPVIESTPFWVPGIPSNLVGIEIQPSAHLLPVTYSTPKPRRHKLNQDELPKLKFSLQYHKASGVLEVQLLDTANLSLDSPNLDDAALDGGDSSVFLFSNVQLTQQEETKKRLRLMSRRRRRRHKSFEIEMSYEALQLQTLQFCVMGYDEYSRNKVIGDVLLPLAELAQQGLDITRELVMWRDIQTCQPRSHLLRERMGQLSSIKSSQDVSEPDGTGRPAERKCSTS